MASLVPRSRAAPLTLQSLGRVAPSRQLRAIATPAAGHGRSFSHWSSRPVTSPTKRPHLLYAAAAPISLLSWLGFGEKDARENGSSNSNGAKANSGDKPNGSSAILIKGYESAIRPASELGGGILLAFLNVDHPRAQRGELMREEWRRWIGYLREQGYDCLDVNIVTSGKGGNEEAAGELSQQLRLQMLRRGPVLFAQGPQGAQIAQALHAKGGSAAPEAVVLIEPGAEAHALAQSGVKLFIVEEGAESRESGKLAVFGVPAGGDPSSIEAMREVENWLMHNGF